MRLSKLTLNGFKSFADKTEFIFQDDVIGIVGPNGCGKSNVVDSLKWVLGERSSKNLRGEEMMDVVFAGSAGRKPGGMASVILTFDNPVIDESAEMIELDLDSKGDTEDPLLAGVGTSPEGDAGAATGEEDAATEDQEGGAPPPPPSAPRRQRKRRGLPIDTDTVEVERRLYRDGTSHYLINNRRVRMRDIRDLFLDTGIGADSYSIIEQGKVDAMLMASPKDLRTVFEEAAGISRYKQRRIESQRKLEKAQSNLLLTREQLQNTERRLRLVKGQAAKARRFIELDSERKAWQVALAFRQYDALRSRLESVCADLAGAASAREETEARLAQAQDRRQESEIARQEVQSAHRKLEQDRMAAEHTLQTATQRLQLSQRAREEAQRQLTTDQARLTELDTRSRSVEEDTGANDERIAGLSESLAGAESALEEAGSTRAGVLEAQAQLRSKLDEHRATSSNIARERAGLEAARESERRRAETMHEQLERVVGRLESGRAEARRLTDQLASQEGSVATIKHRLGEAEAALAQLDHAAETLSADQREVQDRYSEQEQAFLRLDSRRQTLAEMVEGRIGLGEAVKDVLERRDAGRARGETSPLDRVIAPLVELIQTGSEYAPALEAALGSKLRALVIRSLGDLPPQEELEALRGRVMFLPTISGESSPRPIIDEAMLQSGKITLMRSVVDVSDEAEGLLSGVEGGMRRLGLALDALLASTLLVDDLDSAMMLRVALAQSGEARVRFVTRDGTVLEADGRVIAGPATSDEGAGLIEHRSELHDLEGQLEIMGAALDEQRQRLESLSAESARLSEDRSARRAAASTMQRELVGEQSRLERTQADLERARRELTGLEEEQGPLRQRIEELETRDHELDERIARLGRLLDEQAEALRTAEADLQRVQTRLEQASEQVTAAKVEAGRLAEQLGAAKRETHRLEALKGECERQRAGLLAHVESASERLAAQERAIHEAGEEIERSRAAIDAVGGSLSELASRLTEADKAVTERAGELDTVRREAQQAERAWNDAEMTRRELIVKLDSVEDRTRSDIGLELVVEYREYRELIESGVIPVDEAEAAANIDELRRAVGKLGNVNIDSIEEETTLEQRNDELIAQVADIDTAQQQLQGLIERLNVASKDRFGEMFEQIREHFAGKDGMYRKLFGGGKAEVKLLPLVKEIDGQKVQTDEIDLLESGIEIFAKPPGKEPQTIRQLSGGEKTLTVVALLLAIFKTKPSCFCVLDEVDAALDDANVRRYNDVVREFTTHSHFIVITHNKRTMQMADRLYGITMQERGVSTRVTVRFDQVGSDGKIEPPTENTSSNESSSHAKGSLRRGLSAMQSERQTVQESETDYSPQSMGEGVRS